MVGIQEASAGVHYRDKLLPPKCAKQRDSLPKQNISFVAEYTGFDETT